MDNLPATITSTIQSASLNRAPSPTHDLAPSSTVSCKLPVEVDSLPASAPQSDHVTASSPTYAVRPAPRRAALPPLPDLRFEQSYLASLKNARGWKAVCWITVRDQVRPSLRLSASRSDTSLSLHSTRSFLNPSISHSPLLAPRQPTKLSPRSSFPSSKEPSGRFCWLAGATGTATRRSRAPVPARVSVAGGGASTNGQYPREHGQPRGARLRRWHGRVRSGT